MPKTKWLLIIEKNPLHKLSLLFEWYMLLYKATIYLYKATKVIINKTVSWF